MSFQKEKRDIIKRYLLEKIRLDDPLYIEKTIQWRHFLLQSIEQYRHTRNHDPRKSDISKYSKGN